MKRKLFTLLILLVSVFTVVAISNTKEAEAYNVKSGTYFYFEKPETWDKAVTQLMIGHSGWSQGYEMTNITGTDIYYVSMPNWDGYYDLAFFNTDSVWGGEGSKISDRKKWAPGSTSMINPNKDLNGYNFYISDENYNTTEIASKKDSYLDMNVNITASVAEGGVASVSGYKLNTATAATINNAASTSVLMYTDATLTATPNEGYNFVGWYSDENYTTLVSEEATYTLENVTAAATYYAKFEFDTTPIKTLINSYYRSEGYVRNTEIFADFSKIEGEMTDYFHRPGENNDNVFNDRTTHFVGNYLYFEETNVAFGTSSEGKLTSFTWNGTAPTAGTRNAIENYFVTLFDFANLVNTSNGKEEISLANGWSESNGVYTSEDDEVIAAAVAFTAPGWISPDKHFVDYTKVTVEVINSELVISVWVTGNEGLLDTAKLAEAHLGTEGVCVFSRARIAK